MLKIKLTKVQKIAILGFIIGYILMSLILWFTGAFAWYNKQKEITILPIYYSLYPFEKRINPVLIFLLYGH